MCVGCVGYSDQGKLVEDGTSFVEGAQEPFHRGAACWGLGARWNGCAGGPERRSLGPVVRG